MAVLICAKAKSRRFPGKHFIEYKGLPLWKHTFNFAKKLGKEVFVFSDDDAMAELAVEYSFNFIRDIGGWKSDPQMDMMQYIHEKIKADVYIMLPITSPNRKLIQLLKCLSDFLKSSFAGSATALTKIDRGNYKLSGAFWFFRKKQFYRSDVINENTMYFRMDSIDVDTPEDLKDEN